MTWEQVCLFCEGTGIDIDNSDPGSGPTEYSMGEPPYWEPCICQYALIHTCRDCGELWFYDQPVCLNPDCPSHLREET